MSIIEAYTSRMHQPFELPLISRLALQLMGLEEVFKIR